MAGQITHMEVAYRLIDRLGIVEGKEEYIPGGEVEGHEHYAECCEREMLEETAYSWYIR